MAPPPTEKEWEFEVHRLLEPRSPLGLPVPAYQGRSLPNVTSSVVRALGVEVSGNPALAPPLADPVDPFGGRRAEGPIVVFLADAFGGQSFATWSRGESPAGRRWAGFARPITTVFPTTTTAALVSLSSGTFPGRSGVVGYRQFLPAFGVVADLLRMTPVGVHHPESLVGPLWNPGIVSQSPPVFRRGVTGIALSRDRFQGTGFTRMLYDGAEYVPYVTASDLAHLLLELLSRPKPPAVIYTYWDELDTVHHFRGPTDSLFGFEADRLAHLVEYVGRHLEPGRARSVKLLLTADHGQVPVDPERCLRVDLVPEIAREMVRPLAGDRRAGYFQALPGRVDALHEALDRHLPRGSRIVEVPEAIAAGLFGPPPHHPELAQRLGELIVFVPPPHGLTSVAPGARASTVDFRGGHGGLAPEELVVPLVAGSMADLAGPG
jgi:hypothetical protein